MYANDGVIWADRVFELFVTFGLLSMTASSNRREWKVGVSRYISNIMYVFNITFYFILDDKIYIHP